MVWVAVWAVGLEGGALAVETAGSSVVDSSALGSAEVGSGGRGAAAARAARVARVAG